MALEKKAKPGSDAGEGTRVARRILLCGIAAAVLLFLFSSVRISIGGRISNGNYLSPRIAIDPTKVERSRRVTFVPFPYKPLVSGEDAQCIWSTKYVDNATFSSGEGYDSIQLAVYNEGMCIPDKLKSSLHVFSTAEAIECLNSTEQGRNISVSVSGDSYTRQLFIGLADILLGNPSNEEITTKDRRRHLLREYDERLAALHGDDTSFPDVQYPLGCFGECYGDYGRASYDWSSHVIPATPVTEGPFSVRCSRCINNFTQRSESAVGVVGAGGHNLRYFGNRAKDKAKREGLGVPVRAKDEAIGETVAAVNETIKDLERFFDLATRTIYVSMPSYQMEKVPRLYENATHNTHAGRIYEGLLPSLAPRDVDHPFLDYFQLTKACHMKNCSYDGGHRARYVNRWKAQLLLNTLCEVNNG